MSVPDGWVRVPTQAFGTHVGPFWRPDGNVLVCGFEAQAKHGNKRGVVHGGMIATAFDVALGNACWDAAGQQPSATVQLNIHYIGALKMGDFAVITSEVTRAARTMTFARAVMRVEDRVIATADGVWKVLNWRGETYQPPPPYEPPP